MNATNVCCLILITVFSVLFHPAPTQDLNLTIVDQDSTSLHILAEVSSQYNLTGQLVSCFLVDTDSDCAHLVSQYSSSNNGLSSQVEFSGLQPGGRYNVTVNASHISSQDGVSGSIMECLAPVAVDITSLKLTTASDSILISPSLQSGFQARSGFLDKLKISSLIPAASFANGVTEADKSGTLQIVNAVPATKYTISIQVETCGKDSPTQPVPFCTRPSIVTKLQVSNSARTSVTLTWEKPAVGDFDPVLYEITCNSTNGNNFVQAENISAVEAGSRFNNGTFYFDSSDGYFDLLAETPFTCSVEPHIFSSCYAIGEVVHGTINTTNVQFSTTGVSVEITGTTYDSLTFTANPCNPCVNYNYAEQGGPSLPIPNNQSPITNIQYGTRYSVTVDSTTDYACTKPDIPSINGTSVSATVDSITIHGSHIPVNVVRGDITHYQLTYFRSLNGEVVQAPVDGDLTIESDIFHMEPETNILVDIQSVLTDALYCYNGVDGDTKGYHLCTAPVAPPIAGTGRLAATTENVTIQYSDFNATERLVFQLLGSSLTYSPSDSILKGESLTIGNLDTGRVYNLYARATFSDSGSCLNVAESLENRRLVCTKPPKPTVVIDSKSTESFVFSVSDSTSSYHYITASLSPEENNSVANSNGSVTGLLPGKEYTLNVSLHMNENTCSLMTVESISSEYTLVNVCTHPLPPDITSFDNDPNNFYQTINAITIRASRTPLSNAYFLDYYSLVRTSPSGGVTQGSLVSKDQDMLITGLDSGTRYLLYINGHVGGNCNLTSLSNAYIWNVCTVPRAPNITIASATTTSITIKGSLSPVVNDDQAPSRHSFDKYRITRVNSDSSVIGQATPVDQDATVNKILEAGTVYTVRLRSIKDENCINGGTEGVEGLEEQFTVCTKPPTPIVTIGSRGTHFLVFSIQNPSTQYNSVSAEINPQEINSIVHDNNRTITGLIPGKEYTLTVTLEMDKSICSLMTEDSLRSNSTTITVCTSPLPPDMSAFVTSRFNFAQTTNTLTIKGSRTSLTNGYFLDQYSLDRTVPSGGVTLGRLFYRYEDMLISGLNSGTTYTLHINGHIGGNCNQTSQSTSMIENICTAPSGPYVLFASASTTDITVQGSLSRIRRGPGSSASETFDKYRITAIDSNLVTSTITPVDQDATVNFALVHGTIHNVTVQSIKDENCINGGSNGVEGEESTITVCSPPDRLSTSNLQFGVEIVRAFFSGISGVDSGSYQSIKYSIKSSINLCNEQYTATIPNLNERQNTSMLTIGCSYDIQVWAECMGVKGPSTNFSVFIPAYDINVTITEQWRTSTTIEFIVDEMQAAHAISTDVDCEDVHLGFSCPIQVSVVTIDSERARVTVSNLTPGSLHKLLFTFAVGISGLHSKTLYVCMDAPQDLNWIPPISNYTNFEITTIPTKCPVANRSLLSTQGSSPDLSVLEKGCEYKIYSFVTCTMLDGSTIRSNYAEHSDTYCTEPSMPSRSLSIDFATDQTIYLSGFEVAHSYYDAIEVDVSTTCLQSAWFSVFSTYDTELQLSGLIPGCRYALSYAAVCYTNSHANHRRSGFVAHTMRGKLCTEPARAYVNLDVANFDATSLTLTWSLRPQLFIPPISYEVTIVQQGTIEPIIAVNITASAQNMNARYQLNTKEDTSLELPPKTQFTCSVRPIISYSCDFEEVFGHDYFEEIFHINSIHCWTSAVGFELLQSSYLYIQGIAMVSIFLFVNTLQLT